MSKRSKFWVALITIVAFGQTACYNRYFVTKDELRKLESGVEVKRVVRVKADCPTKGKDSTARGSSADRPKYAAAGKSKDKGKNNKKASDASPPKKSGDKSGSKASGKKKEGKYVDAEGCTRVPVSTSNAVSVVLDNGATRRLTPFNFMMSTEQLVSPEYDLLLSLDRVRGAEVREFSLWKTLGMIAGVTAVSVGTFVGISLASEPPDDY